MKDANINLEMSERFFSAASRAKTKTDLYILACLPASLPACYSCCPATFFLELARFLFCLRNKVGLNATRILIRKESRFSKINTCSNLYSAVYSVRNFLQF